MSQQAIRGALQSRLMTLGWADQTAWEDRHFAPTGGVPYQIVRTIFAEPNSYSVGEGAFERGVFQVMLAYPLNSGVGVSTARAEAIRAAFPNKLNIDGLVKIMRRGKVTRLGADGDRDLTSIRIRFSER